MSTIIRNAPIVFCFYITISLWTH